MPGLSAPAQHRVAALVLALAAAGVLAVAFTLAPSEDGHGTHRALGLPACGWVVAFDRPCPACGMTTAFAHAARGDLLGAATVQPMGTLLSVATAASMWAGLHGALLGRRLDWLADGLLRPRTVWIGAALAALAWLYKILTWA